MLADKNNPIRCSKLKNLIQCTMRQWLIEMLEIEDDGEGGEAAQTGSLTHKGVDAFHRVTTTLAERKKAAWEAIVSNRAKFPLANEDEVRLFMTPYMDDPRNIDAKICKFKAPLMNEDKSFVYDAQKRVIIQEQLMIEYPVEFTLEPHALDPTGCQIHIWGTFDQIRMVGNTPTVFDLKTGKISAFQMQADYAVQMAAYTYGARAIGIKGCQPGPYIRPMSYRARDAIGNQPQGVFISSFRWEHVNYLLDTLRLAVALYRSGEVNFGTGPHCTYCEFGGFLGCVQEYQKLEVRLKRS